MRITDTATLTLFSVVLSFFVGGLLRAFEVNLDPEILRIPGDIFIRLITLCIIPLVMSSLVGAMARFSELGKVGKMAGMTFFWYLVTLAVALALGLFFVNLIEPGKVVRVDFGQEFDVGKAKLDLRNFLYRVFPKNIVEAMAQNQMMAVVFFSMFFGTALSLSSEKTRRTLGDIAEAVQEVSVRMVKAVMLFAPVGVASLILSVVISAGLDVVLSLGAYFVTVALPLAILVFVVYPFLARVFAGIGYREFFGKLYPAQITAFATSSSAAALPVTITAVQNLGVRSWVANFVLPVGATVNMDGTALFQTVTVVFISQLYGAELSLLQQFYLVFLVVLASVGTAPVPSASIVLIVLMLEEFGLPAGAVALVLGIDRILDMMRTAVNVTSDATCSILVSRALGEVEREGTR